MRKLYFLMIALTILGISSACEKEFNDNSSDGNNGTLSNNEKNDQEAMELFVGLWNRTVIPEEISMTTKKEYAWRFYKDGTGYLSIDTYNQSGVINGITRAEFTYWVKNGLLYVLYGNNRQAIEWQYRFTDEGLHLKSDMDEYGIDYIFTRAEDASSLLMGDWIHSSYSDDKRVEKHLKLKTPVDGHIYEVQYNKEGTDSEYISQPTELKYTFDDEQLQINYICCDYDAPTITYYYRLEGDNLYLSSSKNGIEEKYYRWK